MVIFCSAAGAITYYGCHAGYNSQYLCFVRSICFDAVTDSEPLGRSQGTIKRASDIKNAQQNILDHFYNVDNVIKVIENYKYTAWIETIIPCNNARTHIISFISKFCIIKKEYIGMNKMT